MQYPLAGTVRMMVFGFKCYVRAVIYPPLLDALGDRAKAVELEPAEYYSTEICRTFAGLEDAFDDNPDSFLPLFTSLILATTTCPRELRVWLWCKLIHFENLCNLTFDSVMRNIASVVEYARNCHRKICSTEGYAELS